MQKVALLCVLNYPLYGYNSVFRQDTFYKLFLIPSSTSVCMRLLKTTEKIETFLLYFHGYNYI